jgi:hypothetical protein
MDRRHAAALALLGWYLMTPPVRVEGEKRTMLVDRPFSDWTASFDTAEACAGFDP